MTAACKQVSQCSHSLLSQVSSLHLYQLKDSLCVRVLSWTINSSSVIHYNNLTNLHPIISIIRYCQPFGVLIRFNKQPLHNHCHSPTGLRGFKFGLVCYFVYNRSVIFVCVFAAFGNFCSSHFCVVLNFLQLCLPSELAPRRWHCSRVSLI